MAAEYVALFSGWIILIQPRGRRAKPSKRFGGHALRALQCLCRRSTEVSLEPVRRRICPTQKCRNKKSPPGNSVL